MLNELQNLVDKLNETNSNLDKKAVLKKYPQCKQLLSYIYSPFKQFNVTSKNLKKRKDLFEDTDIDIITLLNKLSDREVTGHAAISLVNGFIQKNQQLAKELLNSNQ